MSDPGKENAPMAFPNTSDWAGSNGMTLRDYFAGQALAGLMSSTDPEGEWTAVNGAEPYAAKWAYQAADAMLAERAKAPSA